MLYAFLLTTIAGFSTLIGFLFIYIKKSREVVVSSSLGFASGIMLTISIIDLMPNSLLLLIKYNTAFITFFLMATSFIIGIILSNILDNIIEKNNNSKKLYKIGIISMIAIIIHNIPEGIVTYITTTNNSKLGLLLALAIAFHNIPEGIAVSIPIYYSTKSKFKAFSYTFISGIAEPIGAIIAYLFLAKYINNTILGLIYAFVAGIMTNISINELYKKSKEYNKNKTIIFFIIGCLVMIINHLLFG